MADSRLGSDPLSWLKNKPGEEERKEDTAAQSMEQQPEKLAEDERAAEEDRVYGGLLGRLLDDKAEIRWNPAEALDKMRTPFCVAAPDGRILYANQGFAELTGYDPVEIAGLDWNKDFCDDSHASCEEGACGMLLIEGGEEDIVTCLRRKDGSSMDVRIERNAGSGRSGLSGCWFLFVWELASEELGEEVPCAAATSQADAGAATQGEPVTHSTILASSVLMDIPGDMAGLLEWATRADGAELDSKALEQLEAMQTGFLAFAVQDYGPFEPYSYNAEDLEGLMSELFGLLLVKRGYDEGVVNLEMSFAELTIPQAQCVFAAWIVYAVLYSVLAKPGKIAGGTVRLRLRTGSAGQLHIGITADDDVLVKKIKLHDKKAGALQTVAQSIVERSGSIFLIRSDVTQIKMTLAPADGGEHGQG